MIAPPTPPPAHARLAANGTERPKDNPASNGWPACSYSRDGGHTWRQPAYKTCTLGGQLVEHPRAANCAWDCSNGKFLCWFHNHGGAFIRDRGGRTPNGAAAAQSLRSYGRALRSSEAVGNFRAGRHPLP